MIYAITASCPKCRKEVTALFHEGEIVGKCPDCGVAPFSAKKYKGIIYIAHNRHQTGVKIGMTERPIRERIKALNATGVPGKTVALVIFPTRRPRYEEQRVHNHGRLRGKRIDKDKEHFDVSPIKAALCAFRKLNYRTPIFLDKKIEKEFWKEVKATPTPSPPPPSPTTLEPVVTPMLPGFDALLPAPVQAVKPVRPPPFDFFGEYLKAKPAPATTPPSPWWRRAFSWLF